jgi:hypothetical protein
MGPTLRRNDGGALVPDGETSVDVALGGHWYRMQLWSRAGGLSTFTLERIAEEKKSAFGSLLGRKAAPPEPDCASISILKPVDNTPCQLTASAHGWKSIQTEENDPGRLFIEIEDGRPKRRGY